MLYSIDPWIALPGGRDNLNKKFYLVDYCKDIWSFCTSLPFSWQLPQASSPVVNVVKLFWQKSRFPQNFEIEKSLFWCLNLHKNVKTMHFKQNYTLKLFIALKMAYSCSFINYKYHCNKSFLRKSKFLHFKK